MAHEGEWTIGRNPEPDPELDKPVTRREFQEGIESMRGEIQTLREQMVERHTPRRRNVRGEDEIVTEEVFLRTWHSLSLHEKQRLMTVMQKDLPTPEELTRKEYLSVPEASIFSQLSQGRIKQLISSGDITGAGKDTRGRYRIPRSSLESRRKG